MSSPAIPIHGAAATSGLSISTKCNHKAAGWITSTVHFDASTLDLGQIAEPGSYTASLS